MMRAILHAQQQGEDFSTLLHLLAKRLGLKGRELSKVADTACEYVSYCSNPELLEKYREPLDWVMLLFFVLNNSTSTYEGGTKNVPVLTNVEDILQHGIDDKNVESYDLFLSLAALLQQSIYLAQCKHALGPMVEAFQGFHKRMAKAFLSGSRPDTNLEDYYELRRTTIATFWWRDILVCFLGTSVEYDSTTTDAIADAVWLGNDIRSVHRDESNVLDFITEDDLIERLAKTYDDLENAFKYLSPLHREVACLIVIGTTAIYPAMDKYGGSRYACNSTLALRARRIQIDKGLKLVAKAPALKAFPLIADALREWEKPLESATRRVQLRSPFGKACDSMGFYNNRLNLRDGVCRINLETGAVSSPSETDELMIVAKIVSLSQLILPGQDREALELYFEVIDKFIEKEKPAATKISSDIDLTLRTLTALTILRPHEFAPRLITEVDSLLTIDDFVATCDALAFALGTGCVSDVRVIERTAVMVEAQLELAAQAFFTSTEPKLQANLIFWAKAASVAWLCLMADEGYSDAITRLRTGLGRVVTDVIAGVESTITHGYYHVVVDRALCKVVCGLDATREVVCINGILSTSRMVCEPIGGLVMGTKDGTMYALSSHVFTSLLGFALVSWWNAKE